MSVNGFLSQTTEIPRQQSDVAGVVKYKTNSPSSQCQILHPVKNIHLISKRRRHQTVTDRQKPSRHNQHKMLREILQDKQRQQQTAAPIGEKEWVRAPATARRDETGKNQCYLSVWILPGKRKDCIKENIYYCIEGYKARQRRVCGLSSKEAQEASRITPWKILVLRGKTLGVPNITDVQASGQLKWWNLG